MLADPSRGKVQPSGAHVSSDPVSASPVDASSSATTPVDAAPSSCVPLDPAPWLSPEVLHASPSSTSAPAELDADGVASSPVEPPSGGASSSVGWAGACMQPSIEAISANVTSSNTASKFA